MVTGTKPATWYPGGGLRKNDAPSSTATRYARPSGRKTLGLSVVLFNSVFATGAVITAPKPKPATAIPVISPR